MKHNFQKLLRTAQIQYSSQKAASPIERIFNLDLESMNVLFKNIITKEDLVKFYELKKHTSLILMNKKKFLHANKHNLVYMILWSQKILSYFTEEINEYKKTLDSIEFLIFTEKYEIAQQLLNNFINTFGYSLKILEIQILLSILIKDSQQNFEIDTEDQYLKFYKKIIEAKCNNLLDGEKLRELVEKSVKNQDISNYILFKIKNNGDNNIGFYINILKFDLEIRNNYFDLYESYIEILDEYNIIKFEEPRILKNAISLNKKINDKNLIFIKNSDDFSKEEISKRIKIFELDAQKNYSELFSASKNLFLENFNLELIDITSLLLIVKSYVNGTLDQDLEFLDRNEHIKKIKESFISIFSLDENTFFNAYNLYRYLNKYDVFTWAIHLKNIFSQYIKISETSQQARDNLIMVHYKDIFFNPYHHLYLINSKNNNYNQTIINKIKIGSILKEKFDIIENKISNYEEFSQDNLINFIEISPTKIDLDNLENLDQNKLTTKDKIIIDRAYILKLNSLKRYKQSLNYFIDSYFRNSHIYPLLPFIKVANIFVNLDKREFLLEKIIFIYILLDKEIYEKEFESYNLKTKLSVCIENYIENTYKTINDIFDIDFNNLNQNDIFLLGNIFKKEILKYTLLFDNELEIDKFRIRLCQKLTSVEHISKDIREELSTEIKEIAKNIAISKGKNLVNMSKIHVDTQYVKKACISKLKNSYQTFKELKNIDSTNNNNVIIIDDIGEINNLGEVTDLIKKLITSNSSNEDFTRLRYIAKEVLDEFLKGPSGLNAFLSTAIRHGVLKNFLKNPLVLEQIILLKNTDYLNHLSQDLSSKVVDLAILFEQKFDSLIDDLISNKIQISIIEAENEGLFEYTFKYVDYYRLQLQSDNIEDLVNFTIELIWKKTDNNLAKIRYYLIHIFKDQIKKIFDDFETEVLSLSTKYNTPLNNLTNKIYSSRSKVFLKIDEIVTWFNRSNIFYEEDYPITTIISIAKNMLEEINPTLQDWDGLNLSDKSNKDILVPGRLLNPLVYIFYGLLENAYKHSKLKPNFLFVNINIKNDANLLVFDIKSNIIEDADYLNEIKSKLLSIKDIIALNNATLHAQKDTSSGLYKLYNLIKTDEENNHFDFNVDMINQEFIVNFKYLVPNQ